MIMHLKGGMHDKSGRPLVAKNTGILSKALIASVNNRFLHIHTMAKDCDAHFSHIYFEKEVVSPTKFIPPTCFNHQKSHKNDIKV